MKRDFITLLDFSGEEIEEMIDKAIEIKSNIPKYSKELEGKTLAMLFQKTSTRTRASFEAGMTQLGGHAMFLDWRTTNFAIGGLKDEIKVLSRYADAIMFRPLKNADVVAAAQASEVPVINGLCELYHPCQILTDLMTIKEKLGKLSGEKIAYVGAGDNVCNSLIIGCAKVGAKISVGTPKEFAPMKQAVEFGKKQGLLELTTDPKEAVKDAKIVYTDSWLRMEFFKDGKIVPEFKQQYEEMNKALMPFQLNAELVDNHSPNALIMHDMPCHEGYEISRNAIEHKNAILFDQAENRMHAQKALLLKLIKNQ